MRVIFQDQAEWFVPEGTRLMRVIEWERVIAPWQRAAMLKMLEERLEQEQ